MTNHNDHNHFCVKGIPIGVYANEPVAYLAITKTNTTSQSPLQWETLAATSPAGLGELVGRTLNGHKLHFGNQVGSNAAYLQSPRNATPVYYHLAELTPDERTNVEDMRTRTKTRLNMFRYTTTIHDGKLTYNTTIPHVDGSTHTISAESYAGIHKLANQARRTATPSTLD